MNYRADIDGLRALAILPVVLFHANITGFAGGFVGVDVFFVISGYLITAIIVGELRNGTFSLRRFWARRARRLLPALFSVVFFSLVVATPLLLLNHLQGFAASVIATIFYVSNIYFWQSGGSSYFAQPTTFLPLLHTWSLAIEEQFYIVLPLALLLIRRWLPGRLEHWLVLAFVLSFTLAWWGTLAYPTAAFYLLPTRAWELLLGGLLALGVVPAVRQALWRELLALLGIGMIGGAVFTYSSATIFPGPGAVLPCLGTALVIHSGRDGRTLVHRLLAWPPLVGIGLLSYSIYLWHWPLLVFAGYWHIDPLGPAQIATVLTLTLVLSYLTWRHVERPWRDRRIIKRPRTVVLGATAASGFALVASLVLLSIDPVTGRSDLAFDMPAHRVAAATSFNQALDDANPDLLRCHANDARPIPLEEKCIYGAPDQSPSLALWGDSHALELGYVLGAMAQESGEALLYSSYSVCPPAVEPFEDARSPCIEHNHLLLDHLKAHPTIETVVLTLRYLVADYRDQAALLAGLGKTVTELREAGKRVVVVGPVPEPRLHVPFATGRAVDNGTTGPDLFRSRRSFNVETAAVRAWTARMADMDGVSVVYPHELLCDEARCTLARDGRPLYFDDNHLTLTAWRELMPLFRSIFGRTEAPATSEQQLPPRRSHQS